DPVIYHVSLHEESNRTDGKRCHICFADKKSYNCRHDKTYPDTRCICAFRENTKGKDTSNRNTEQSGDVQEQVPCFSPVCRYKIKSCTNSENTSDNDCPAC